MYWHCYLRKGVVYIPTLARVDVGGYMDVEPVAVIPVSNTAELKNAFRATIQRGNPVTSALPRAAYPPPVVLKYAGLKSFHSFARGTSNWGIEENKGTYNIVGHRKHPDGGWEQDPSQQVALPVGSSVDDVCDRMVAMLQQHAQSSS